jgi:lysophospholipase L1-like esterase
MFFIIFIYWQQMGTFSFTVANHLARPTPSHPYNQCGPKGILFDSNNHVTNVFWRWKKLIIIMHTEIMMSLEQLIQELYNNELKVQPADTRLPDPSSIIYDHFHAVSNNSSEILCCFGDSYTKGAGLNTKRLETVFGAVLSQRLGMDWVNAGGSGYGNCWMLYQLEYIIDWLNSSDYTGGLIVLTFTENGRDIKNNSHHCFDYIKTYGHLPITKDFYQHVCDDIEQLWIDRLRCARAKIDTRFRIVVGMNFIWHDRLEAAVKEIDGIDFINESWIEILAKASNQKAPPRVQITHLDAVGMLNIILNIDDQSHYKHWYLERAEIAMTVMNWMANTPVFFEKHDLGHPNAAGHAAWADKIIELTSRYHSGARLP